MAKIEGVRPGFVPEVEAVIPEKKRRKRPVTEKICCSCERVMKTTSKFLVFDDDYDEYYCRGCAIFFGVGPYYQGGTTALNIKNTKEKMAEFDSQSWGLVLKAKTFASSTTGRNINIELGDILKVVRVGVNTEPEGTWEHAQDMYSVDVQVGTERIKLFLHELSHLSWPNMMQMRADGEIEETFLESGDEWGVYHPTEELRSQINACFGNR